MRVLGVDPGAKGALCLYNTDLDKLLIADMPVVDGRVNPYELVEIIDGWQTRRTINLAAVELVHSMPKQGVASSFKFGMGYGMILGVLATCEIPVMHVTPTVWTKAHSVGPDKELHRRRAIETWPKQATLFKRKMDEGRADAALIALWAARCHAQERDAG